MQINEEIFSKFVTFLNHDKIKQQQQKIYLIKMHLYNVININRDL